MSNPFDLENSDAYNAWRAAKLAAYPTRLDALRVKIKRLAAPSSAERAALIERIARFNLAIVRTDDGQITPDAVLAFGRHLGLTRADSNLFADRKAVSTISPGGGDARADYVPYTSRPLSWHTDGYYNPPDRQVQAWTLFCRHAASDGGANMLLDHEIAYILLRDASPEHIRALSHPEAFRIPANMLDGRVIRAESIGAVFSVRDGALHMRYSARTRHAAWRATAETAAAREALDRLFSSAPTYTFTSRLVPGEGLVSNNVLHGRSAFTLETGDAPQRLLYRVRYLDRIQPRLPSAQPD